MNCLRFYFLCIAFSATALTSWSQILEFPVKPVTGVNQEELRKIDGVMQHYLEMNWLRSAVTLVIKDNQVIQYKGYGYTETKKPMPEDAIFRIMSQTKAVTSVAIMMLYEKGLITLDEPISDFIPEFRHPVVLDKYHSADTTYTTVPAKREITFRDLLSHSGGLDYAAIGTPTGKAMYAKAGVPSGLGNIKGNLLDKMKILARLPLLYQPGEKWQYSLSSDLLGCLIEVISGTTLDNFFSENIFQPMGMKDTYFTLPAAKFSRLATVYTEDSLTHQVIRWNHTFRNLDPDYPMFEKHYFSGGAGLSSTAFDYAVFMQMLLNGGIYNGHRFLSPRTVQMMTSNQLGFPYNGADAFGLGFAITSASSAGRNPRNEGSFAWGGYYGTTFWADPKAHLVCLIMTQQSPNTHGEISTKIENIIYSSLTN